MQNPKVKQFSPDDIITALLAYLPREFSNNPEKIHRTIHKLQQEDKYNDLLHGFEFLDYARFPYSPLLGRILNRLQESRLLSSRNPDYAEYQIKDGSREAILSYYCDEGKSLSEQQGLLKEIANSLETALKNEGA